MPVSIKFSGPYLPLLESFCEPDEPIRVIGDLSFVQIYRGKIRGQSGDNRKVFDCIATVAWDEDGLKFVTPDGKEWSQFDVDVVEEDDQSRF